MKKSLFLLFTFFLLQSCNSENNRPSPEQNNPATMPSLSLVCEEISPQIDPTLTHVVNLLLDGKKIKLAKTPACETFKKEDYKKYQMPKNAIDACGGWAADAGEYFYIDKNTDGSYSVNYGQMYKQKITKKYDYTELVRIKKDASGKYIAYPKHQLKDLAGVYTLEGNKTSWMLIIRPDGEDIKTTYYTFEGKLPTPDDMKKNNISIASTQILKNFEVDFSDMIIESDIGMGQLETIFGRKRITFFNIKSHLEDMLRVTKNDAYDFLIANNR